MSPHIQEKIIERPPLANSPALRYALQAAILGLGLLFFFRIAHAEPVFDRSQFSKIEFSGGCNQKQWTSAPDNSLELLIEPAKDKPCEARLLFYFPHDVSKLTVLNYEARSAQAGRKIRVGVEQADGSALYAPASSALTAHWNRDHARLSHIMEGWTPDQVAALHFVVLPNEDLTAGRSTVMIRGLRLVQMAAGVAATDTPASEPPVRAPAAQPPHAAVHFVAPVAPVASPLPVPFSLHRLLSFLRSASTKALWPIAAMALFFWVTKSKTHRRRILSPLFEINMRLWKTERDTHGVVQFGGFKKISLSDLKSIKQQGFNAIWPMGIWEVGAKVRAISKNYGEDFQGSPFAIQDYAISSDLGTEQEFRELVQRAHSVRLSVIVDFIPNHMGLDTAWLNDHPEFFIHQTLSAAEAALSDDELQKRYPSYFPYRTPSYPEGGRRVPKTIMVAYGKDPYFYPWIDTAQLDYANPGLRKRMIDLLCHWAKTVDGVRCDMAMLVLREQVKVHRHPEMGWQEFNQLMPNEFWTEAIQAVKKVNPNFVFMAETYWSMEGYLQNLGFDYTYNKPLYEAICSAVHSGHAEGLMNFLRLLGTDFLKRSVHFLENHDEDRAMNVLGDERQKAAAAILCTLPGIALVHQGQMEGKRERLPVQRVIPIHKEPEHSGLHQFYQRLLKATALPVFQEGRMIPLYSNNPALASYARLDDDSKVLVIVNTSNKKQQGTLFLMPGLRLRSDTPYRLKDLFYEFKAMATGTVQPSYTYPGAKLINQGLYVELDPFDSHIFVMEAQGAMESSKKLLGSTRHVIDAWPMNRMARRVLGAAFTRSADLPTQQVGSNLAANPTGRQS